MSAALVPPIACTQRPSVSVFHVQAYQLAAPASSQKEASRVIVPSPVEAFPVSAAVAPITENAETSISTAKKILKDFLKDVFIKQSSL
jgi:hypothetical protein